MYKWAHVQCLPKASAGLLADAGKYHNWLVRKAARFEKCGENL